MLTKNFSLFIPTTRANARQTERCAKWSGAYCCGFLFFFSPFSGTFQPVFLLKISLLEQNHPFLNSIISQVNLQYSK